MTVRVIIGPRQSHAAIEEQIGKMFGDVKKVIARNSETDFLRMSNQRGFCNLTSVNATETHRDTASFHAHNIWGDTIEGRL